MKTPRHSGQSNQSRICHTSFSLPSQWEFRHPSFGQSSPSYQVTRFQASRDLKARPRLPGPQVVEENNRVIPGNRGLGDGTPRWAASRGPGERPRPNGGHTEPRGRATPAMRPYWAQGTGHAPATAIRSQGPATPPRQQYRVQGPATPPRRPYGP